MHHRHCICHLLCPISPLVIFRLISLFFGSRIRSPLLSDTSFPVFLLVWFFGIQILPSLLFSNASVPNSRGMVAAQQGRGRCSRSGRTTCTRSSCRVGTPLTATRTASSIAANTLLTIRTRTHASLISTARTQVKPAPRQTSVLQTNQTKMVRVNSSNARLAC